MRVLLIHILLFHCSSLFAQATLIPFYQDGKYGYANPEMEIVIPCIYDLAEAFEGDYAIVANKINWEGGYRISYAAVVDLQGNRIVDFDREVIRGDFRDPFPIWEQRFISYGAASPRGRGALSIIKLKEGKTILVKDAPEFVNLIAFTEGRGLVFNGSGNLKSGFIDENGKMVIPMKYRYVSPFSEGLAAVCSEKANEEENPKHGFLDKNGKLAIPYQYTNANSFSEGLASVSNEEGFWGFINPKGKLIIPFQFENPGFKELAFKEGLAAVQTDNKFGYINSKGETVIPFDYEDANHFSEGLAAVKKDGLWGFINPKGEIVIDHKYADNQENYIVFHHGLACVQEENNGMYGFIDANGETVLEFQYGDVALIDNDLLIDLPIRGFRKEGICKVLTPEFEDWVYIDRRGRVYAR